MGFFELGGCDMRISHSATLRIEMTALVRRLFNYIVW